MDNVIREFSFAKPSWVLSYDTMFYKYVSVRAIPSGRVYFG